MATVPEVLRLVVPPLLTNPSDLIVMFAEDVSPVVAPIFKEEFWNPMTAWSFVVPEPLASITIDEVTACIDILCSRIGSIEVCELEPDIFTPPVPLLEITVLVALTPLRNDTPKVSAVVAVEVPVIETASL
jgi:hypothetical protein